MARVKREERQQDSTPSETGETQTKPSSDPAVVNADLNEAFKEAAVVKRALDVAHRDWKDAETIFFQAKRDATSDKADFARMLSGIGHAVHITPALLHDLQRTLPGVLEAVANEQKLEAVAGKQKKRKLEAQAAFDEANDKVKRICATIIDKS